MAGSPSILAMAGSRRRGSYNQKLLQVAADGALARGVAVDFIDWRGFDMPLFEDEPHVALPETVTAFRQQLLAHQGLLVSCPEYNSSLTPLLKNALDWASCPVPGEPAYLCFRNKVVALLSASPGKLGGLRGLGHVRDIFSHLGATVLPEQYGLGEAARAFDEQGQLADPERRRAVQAVGARLADIVRIWT